MMKSHLHKQQGLTLIELMIAMTLSLIVVFAVGTILVTSNKTASISSTLSDSQETGRFAIDYITRQLLRAGFNPSQNLNVTKLAAFPPICSPDPADVMCLSNSDNNIGDRIAIQRTAEAGTDNAVTCSGGRLQDGAGVDITTDTIVVDAFWIGEDSEQRLNLRCQTYDADGTILGAAGTPFTAVASLALGVVGMHALYGESNTPPQDQIFSVNRYVSADNVTDWNNIYAIRLAIITEALNTTQGKASEQVYTLLDADQYKYNDQTSRQVFTTTIALLNLARGEE